MDKQNKDLQSLAREIAEQVKLLLKKDEYPPILTVAQAAKINKTMTAREVIVVTTHFGNKRVESHLNGVVSNCFHLVRPW